MCIGADILCILSDAFAVDHGKHYYNTLHKKYYVHVLN